MAFQNNSNRSKSSNEVQNKKGVGKKLLNDQVLDNQAMDDSKLAILENNLLRTEFFCGGNKELIGLVSYFNHKLRIHLESSKLHQK